MLSGYLMRLVRLDSLAKQTKQNKDVFMRRKQYWRIWKTRRIIIFQQKLLHAFAVVMKQCTFV